MIIDLRINHVDYLNYSYEYRIKSTKLLTSLNRLNIGMKHKYNYLIFPMSVYNVIEQSENFKTSNFDFQGNNELRLVGTLGDFICYLDIYLTSNQILVSWDKSTMREVKLENIFSNKKITERTIQVIF